MSPTYRFCMIRSPTEARFEDNPPGIDGSGCRFGPDPYEPGPLVGAILQ